MEAELFLNTVDLDNQGPASFKTPHIRFLTPENEQLPNMGMYPRTVPTKPKSPAHHVRKRARTES